MVSRAQFAFTCLFAACFLFALNIADAQPLPWSANRSSDLRPVPQLRQPVKPVKPDSDYRPPQTSPRSQPAQRNSLPPNGSKSWLSNSAGQVWREYDISTFTRRIRHQEKPEQVVVDWILRETGTNAWFGETMSVLSASSESIRVYHTPEVHQIIEQLMDRFLNSRSEQNEVAARLVTVTHPNWRAKALPRMVPVQTQTPGIEAWILSREDAALLINELSHRGDFREHNSPNLTIFNGQTHTIKSTRPRLFAKTAGTVGAWGGNIDQVEEGFSMQISPLVSADNQSVEAVIKCSVNQVEAMSPLRVNSFDQFGMVRQSQIEVPQISSWQLHERFRWPTNEVLLISRGIVATPSPSGKQGISRLLTPKRAPRANALLFLESRSEVEDYHRRQSMANRTDPANYRGRY